MIAIHGRAAAGRQQHGLGLDEAELAAADIDHQRAGERAVFRRDQCDRAMLLQAADRPRPDLLHETIDDFDAGKVALVHGAIEALTGEGLAMERAVRIAVEETADLVFQLAQALDRRRDQRPGELLMRQPFAALDRVHEVPFDRVAGIDRNVVAALHHPRASAFAEEPLARNRHIEMGIGFERMQCREQPGPARAEDQNVGLELLDCHDFQNTRTRKAKAMMADNAAASVASCFWSPRQSKFSIKRMRNPPSRCTVNKNTRPISAALTTG